MLYFGRGGRKEISMLVYFLELCLYFDYFVGLCGVFVFFVVFLSLVWGSRIVIFVIYGLVCVYCY